jgi:hypothetical protein
MVEMVDFSISNLDSSKVGEEMALGIIILHNHLYLVHIPPESLYVPCGEDIDSYDQLHILKVPVAIKKDSRYLTEDVV